VLAVAGGTGVSFTLPVAFEALRQPFVSQVTVDFVWIVRKSADLLWLADELGQLKDTPGLRICIFVTRENSPHLTGSVEKGIDNNTSSEISSSSSATELDKLLTADNERFTVRFLGDHHPVVSEVVSGSMERSESVGGNIEIVGSGPEAMGSDLRSAVSTLRTEEDVSFYWDSRE
jgi:ferric-chelate reductase